MEVDKINLLTKRDLERKLDLETKRLDKDECSAKNEKLVFFETTFSNHKTQIANQIEKSRDIPKSQLADHFNQISHQILQLQKYVAASNLFIRTYDIKKCQEGLQELTTRAKELEEELLPKKKFSFKTKTTKKPTTNKSESVDDVDFKHKEVMSSTSLFPAEGVCGFSNRIGEIITIKSSECYKKDVAIENVTDCIIKVLGTPSTLHLNNLKECQVITGPVSTSIFIDNCTNSTLVIACQQLRLHNSKNVNIYLHVTSRAIMEDCSFIFLAPYNLKYEGIEDDFRESGLDFATNNWQSVDDFNWLNLEKRSPNWALISEDELVSHWSL